MPFLRGFRKNAKSDHEHRLVCMSVCPSAWNKSAPNGRISKKFDIWLFFENLSTKFEVYYAVAHLVEALRYKPEGREFDSWCCHCNFHWHNPMALSTKNISLGGGAEGGRCLRLTTLPPSCVDCIEIWEPQTPETLRACPGLYGECFSFVLVLRISKCTTTHCNR
jgi:hypothetical protein